MKRPTKLPSNQFTLSLHRQPPVQIDPSSKGELLNVLADLMREALSEGPKPNDEPKDPANESKDHA